MLSLSLMFVLASCNSTATRDKQESSANRAQMQRDQGLGINSKANTAASNDKKLPTNPNMRPGYGSINTAGGTPLKKDEKSTSDSAATANSKDQMKTQNQQK